MNVQKMWNQVRDIVCHYLGELRDEKVPVDAIRPMRWQAGN
jgi:hypothetical protein